MFSKPSISMLAQLTHNNEVEDAVNNLINQQNLPTHEEMENLVLNFVDVFEAEPVPANPIIAEPVPDEPLPAEPVGAELLPAEPVRVEPLPAIPEAPNGEIIEQQQQQLINDVEMGDQDQMTQEALLTVERDVALEEIIQTREEVQQKIRCYEQNTNTCNTILDLLLIREQAINNQYNAMIQQGRLFQNLKGV